MHEKLNSREERWASYQPWLKSLGYDLRRRYLPGWTPSWLSSGMDSSDSEDGIRIDPAGTLLDAVRRSDNRVVMMKLVPTSKKEIPIWQYLSSPELRSDPRNHTVPLLAVHPLPDTDTEALAVMPLLVYFDRLSFETPGEVMLCLYKLTEGLVFLHDNNVAHLDMCAANTMMDPGKHLFPKGFHPIRPTVYTRSPESLRIIRAPPRTSRTLAPVDYYFIDFGESYRFKSVAARHFLQGSVGHSLDIPDFADAKGYDPFKLDIRAFGDMVKKEITECYMDLEPILPWLEALRSNDPIQRPTAAEALDMLKTIIADQEPDFLGQSIGTKKQFLATPWNIYRRHRFERLVLGRPPIYPEIPGIKIQSPKPLGFVARTLGRLSLFFS
ncbi:hypothetical protein SISSUDRAFT_1018146 [Sistotremastrum suecicum HHB10207 ss-3]|uniref:Protein kinase domain-containing protein n=1 Tax=Sistotremastrum suecicum HHB10207 ss-3 TaxID=1314776 RepID=A0A166FWY5_9AGAM|nr:hypothetical protein SISSUDRAFT_1018146 [Sistotremastrum suecicum HHB10207 ss-3]